ncbi:MAG: class I SAM-dependent methyltransferase, partial [Spirochaetia bacterium]
GTGSDTPYIIDIETGKRRKSVKQDTINATRIADALENIDFVMSMARASDVPGERTDRHHLERAFSGRRQELLAGARGRVLEVGVGTGKNLPYYPDHAEVTAIDFSPNMIERARQRRDELQLKNIELREMDVQDLDFSDGSFDTIVSTCVFCSVPLPIAGLRELRRVLNPEGRMLMMEHVRSEKPVAGLMMDILNPLPFYIYGANINRRTIENLGEAGFTRIRQKNLWGDIMKRVEARP